MIEVGRRSRSRIASCESRAQASRPPHARRLPEIGIECADLAARKGEAIPLKSLKALGARIKSMEDRIIADGCDPERTVAVFDERSDEILRQRCRVSGGVPIYPDGVSVEPVQAVLRPEPHEAEPVLEDARDASLGEALVDANVLEEGVALGWRCGSQQESNADACEQERMTAHSRTYCGVRGAHGVCVHGKTNATRRRAGARHRLAKVKG